MYFKHWKGLKPPAPLPLKGGNEIYAWVNFGLDFMPCNSLSAEHFAATEGIIQNSYCCNAENRAVSVCIPTSYKQ